MKQFFAALSLMALPLSPFAQIQFEDATDGSGITHVGESFGASWGDLNGDGWPDLFVNNHRGDPALLVNQGNGSFQNRWLEVDTWVQFPFLDQHGASWADFDGDGDEDLNVSLGATDDPQFLVNENGTLIDRTLFYGLEAFADEPGRLPVWLDFNDDGYLDWMIATRGFSKIFQRDQGNDAWLQVKQTVGLSCQNSQYGQLMDVNGDGRLDLICDNQGLWPSRVFDTSTIPFTNITALIPPQQAVNDSAIGDFDNNLRNDIFQVRGIFRMSEAVLATPQQIEAQLITDNGGEEFMRFETTGVLSFLLDWNRRNRENIFIGSAGLHPDGFGPDERIEFQLDPANPDNWGILPHDPTTEDGVWIGYNDAEGSWEVAVSAGNELLSILYFFIDSTTEITNLTTGGFSAGDGPLDPRLIMNYETGMVEEADIRGLDLPISCVGAASGDFDNDMDQDIYVVCRGGVTNRANILYENQGDGTFIALPDAGGAAGFTGVGFGQGETAAVADYNADGFLDLFVTNGLNIYPEEPLNDSRGGPDRLYRNLGNSNNWVELQLVGTTSNRTAIGAKVYATAGEVTQLREQNGGYHRWSQDHQRIHFGLATNATVDITVEWPSGLVDNFVGLAVNQIYEVTEGASAIPLVLPTTVAPSVCARPEVDQANVAGFYVWKDCVTGAWHILSTAGPVFSEYAGSIIAEAPISAPTAINLETNDDFDISVPERIDFTLRAWTGAFDEFSFVPPEGVPVCLLVTTPGVDTVALGSAQVEIASSFDLHTLGPCTNLPVDVSVSDVAADEDAGILSFTVTLAAERAQPISVDYATVAGTATEGVDYIATAGTLEFLPGEVSQPVNVTLLNDFDGENDETFTLELSNPVSANILTPSATGTIIDDEISACGEPVIDRFTEAKFFIWSDCATSTWTIRTTAGGNYANYLGRLTSMEPFVSVTAVDLEPHDTLDTSLPDEVGYQMQIWGTGIDEIRVQTVPGSELCIDTEIPPGVPVYVGKDRIPLNPPIDLESFGACEGESCH